MIAKDGFFCPILTRKMDSFCCLPLNTSFYIGKGTVSESGTGHLDCGATGPVLDPEPHLCGMSRGQVVCGTATDKSRDTGPYLHVYVVTVILPTKTGFEVSLCFVRHL